MSAVPGTEVEDADTLKRFLLQGAPVRGESVSLDAAWREVSARHDYPRAVRDRLGELCAAGLLLSASLKFDGTLILQIHGDGPVALLVVECEADGRFRATAKLREGVTCPQEADLKTLVNANGRGRFVVTLDPRLPAAERRPYQGIVPLEGGSVAEVLERYMARSEQIPTRLWLAADDARATGLLLQWLPQEGGHKSEPWKPGQADADSPAPSPIASDSERLPDTDAWNRMQQLADTLTQDELLALPSASVLRRLFWQEHLTAFDQRALHFFCSCDREKVAGMLRQLGRIEIESILQDKGVVSVRCEFCNTAFDFDRVDAAGLFLSEPKPPGSTVQH